MSWRTLSAVLTAAVSLAACGGGSEPAGGNGSKSAADEFEQTYSDVEAYPIIVSNELVAGQNRFVIGLLDSQDAPLADPQIDVDVTFYDISGADPKVTSSAPLRWVWIEEGVRGYYIGNAEFPEAGKYGVEIKLKGGGIDEELRAKATVAEESTTPALGTRPPATDTPTLDDVKSIEQISTDSTPVKRFYRYSIAEALDRGRPSVVVFATPKFCQSAVCAPTLDRVQEVAKGFPDVGFVHVEPYELDQLPEQLVPVKAMTEWNLPSEPWVFVMDSAGKVVAKYEGVMAPDELRQALREGG